MVREDSASTGRKRTAEVLISGPKDWGGRQKETGKTVSIASFLLFTLSSVFPRSTHILQALTKNCHEKVTNWIGVLKLSCTKNKQKKQSEKKHFP